MHESLSTTLARRIAAQDGTDVTALEPPLYEVVDVDALEGLFASSNGCGRFSFEYRAYTVTVEYGEEVSITVEKRDSGPTHSDDGFGGGPSPVRALEEHP